LATKGTNITTRIDSNLVGFALFSLVTGLKGSWTSDWRPNCPADCRGEKHGRKRLAIRL